jgi:ribosomal protein L11 methyltransferase
MCAAQSKYLWRKSAEPRWLKAHEEILEARFGGALSIVSTPGRKRSQIEVAFRSRLDALRLTKEFGGTVERIPDDWLKRIERKQKRAPLRIGKRLIVVQTMSDRLCTPLLKHEDGNAFTCQPSCLVIPAGIAFGTGEHATTAMSLRMLEKLIRKATRGIVVDLGTGTGILALAARRFGARHVIGIDFDPAAIATAKANARLNRIRDVDFQMRDVRRWKPPPKIEIVTANLFSELLIDTLPQLRRSRWLILSGILRTQESDVVRALRRNRIEIIQARRRGKWVAILARQLRRR